MARFRSGLGADGFELKIFEVKDFNDWASAEQAMEKAVYFNKKILCSRSMKACSHTDIYLHYTNIYIIQKILRGNAVEWLVDRL